MYKDSGITLIRVLAIFVAIWAASKSVAEEIEGRTALTVLSKPVGRRQFILGKLFGISMSVALLFIVIGIWFVIWTSFKPVYDAVESSKGTVEWTECFNEALSVIPALFLGLLEVVIFVSISVAISTRLGILANFLICFSIYVLGHLTPLIVQSAEAAQAFETVGFFGQLIAIVFPVLNHFDVQAAINTNRGVPMVYIGWSIIYCALYGSITMLLALVLFEDRDLA
jgi:ABC-type transport system involved in multi-copper enzyme maturation permease subunit